MSPTNYRDDILPQDTAEDDSSFETATSQPLSEAEIEDLLYGDGRSTSERLELLRRLRGDIADREGYDVGDDDAEALLTEIDGRIAELEGESDQLGVVFDSDPLAHRETLAPDSDELEELEEEDEASLDEEDEWLDKEEEAGADAYGEADREDFEEEDEEDDEGDIDNDDDVAR
ncbi:MAG TPA: hypothetical protein VHB23_16610 [Devosiaceae bacterium]|jgi:hypothetical protein|nr:hypothetical protein [Devosiaceae bacterium]